MSITPAQSETAAPALEPPLIQIPGAWFLMGSNFGQDCERPIHRVWIDAFLLAATQVTNAEYARFLTATGAAPPPFWQDPNFNHPEQPVTAVSWHEATRYCEWLSTQTARPYRLPTEAEWEHAARGGLEQKQFPWGDAPPQSLPDYATRWQTGPEPVARYAPNAFGLYDICDNVHEWCSDWYDPELLRGFAGTQPARPRTKLDEAASQILPRRLLAPPHQSRPLLRPLQHPPRIPIRRLRLPRSL